MEADIELIQDFKEHLDLHLVLKAFEISLQSKKISYIPYLIDLNEATNNSLQKGVSIAEANEILSKMNQPCIKNQNINHVQLKSLNTLEILKFTDELYNTKITNDDIENVSNELKTRNDIFDAAIQYSSDMKKFYNELYFWYPHLNVSDTLTLILSLFDEKTLIEKYRNYLKEHLILDSVFSEGLYSIIKERFCSSLFANINIMKSDLLIFQCKKNRKVSKKILSHNFWCDKTFNCSPNLRDKLINEKYVIEKHIDENIIYEFCSCLTYVEFSISGQQEITLTVPLEYLDDLMNGCHKYKNYWIEKGIMDSNGRYII